MVQVRNAVLFIMASVCFGCQSSTDSKKSKKEKDSDEQKAPGYSYDLSKPAKSWSLSDSLLEISGISWLNDNELVAIEDLHPDIYLLKLGDQVTIEKDIPFLSSEKNKVDIEDVAIAGDVIYALWSHGTVYKITDWQKNLQVKEIETTFSKENNTEGMCYDPDNKSILLACKDESEIKDERKSTRAVYAMDINSEKVNKDPFLLIHKKDLKKMEDEKFDFYPSAIAVHPVTHNIYVLSTKETKCMAEYTPSGKLVSFQFIDKDLMLQPEGMCFAPDGTLYISSEGKHQEPAKLFRFNPAQ